MLTTFLDAVALALVVVGVALLSVPAALIVAGIGVGVVSYVIAGRS
jgi:hypothetical protein